MTRRSVTDDQYGKLTRRIDELRRRVDEGTLPYNPTMGALTLIIEGELPRPLFKRDMRKERGYELIKEGPLHPKGVEVDDLALQGFLNQGEDSISGDELKERAIQLNANFGQHTIEHLLEHQHEIPKVWRNKFLVFPGTIWRYSSGELSVTGIFWLSRRWVMYFDWLESRFNSGSRLVCLDR